MHQPNDSLFPSLAHSPTLSLCLCLSFSFSRSLPSQLQTLLRKVKEHLLRDWGVEPGARPTCCPAGHRSAQRKSSLLRNHSSATYPPAHVQASTTWGIGFPFKTAYTRKICMQKHFCLSTGVLLLVGVLHQTIQRGVWACRCHGPASCPLLLWEPIKAGAQEGTECLL